MLISSWCISSPLRLPPNKPSTPAPVEDETLIDDDLSVATTNTYTTNNNVSEFTQEREERLAVTGSSISSSSTRYCSPPPKTHVLHRLPVCDSPSPSSPVPHLLFSGLLAKPLFGGSCTLESMIITDCCLNDTDAFAGMCKQSMRCLGSQGCVRNDGSTLGEKLNPTRADPHPPSFNIYDDFDECSSRCSDDSRSRRGTSGNDRQRIGGSGCVASGCSALDNALSGEHSTSASAAINVTATSSVVSCSFEGKQSAPNLPKPVCPPVVSAGLRFGLVTEVAGTSASGKTQLSLTLAARAATESQSVQRTAVVYFTSSNGVAKVETLRRRLGTIVDRMLNNKECNHHTVAQSVRRQVRSFYRQCFGHRKTCQPAHSQKLTLFLVTFLPQTSSGQPLPHKFQSAQALDKIQFVVVKSGYDLMHQLQAIDNELVGIDEGGSSSNNRKRGRGRDGGDEHDEDDTYGQPLDKKVLLTPNRKVLVIVDSISNIITPHILVSDSKDSRAGMALLNDISLQLRRMTRNWPEVGVLVTNHMVSKGQRVGLGGFWQGTADVRIVLEGGEKESKEERKWQPVFRGRVWKHWCQRCTAGKGGKEDEGGQVEFGIGGGGVEEVG